MSKPVASVAAASLVSWLVVWLALGREVGLSAFAGMIAPLVVALGSWVAIERTYRRSPERVTALMVLAFAGKMVFFGAYVIVALRQPSVRAVPFVVSFTSYFIGLHLIEAVWLRRLFDGGGRNSG
jgi:hypothetical protein